MPVLVPSIVGALVPNLASVGALGTGVPNLARAIALGLSQWASLVAVTTVDVGTAGVGKNVPLPITVPTPVLYSNLLIGAASQGLAGIFMPSFTLGLTNGLVLSFVQMLINTQHPGVGVGAGVAKFIGPPAGLSMIAGFQQAGLNGSSAVKKALAIGTGLDLTFAVLFLPVVIVGPPSIFPGAGVGFGKII